MKKCFYKIPLYFTSFFITSQLKLYFEMALVHGKHETEWITISVDEYESMKRTIEVLTDKELMAQIKRGQHKTVKSRDFEEVAKELGI
jgi:PHD/YefM family antitoxin component YafN of YafNO toxin-antitoxin module